MTFAKPTFFILLLFCGSGLCAQSSVQRQIDEEVWRPFVTSFGARDDATFQSVHSRDVARVIQDDGRIIGFEEYFAPTPDSLRDRRAKWKRSIELRFITRIASRDKAFEVGYYRTTSINSETEQRFSTIGKFHVLLRKEKGTWKILMDADTREGASEEAFLAAKPLSD